MARLPQKISFYRPGRRGGFTLIEIMVSVAILASGIVVIFEALLVSLDIYTSYSNYLYTQNWLNEKVWSLQDRLNHSSLVTMDQDQGQLKVNNRGFNWNSDVDIIDSDESLVEFKVDLSWQEGNREVTATRHAYAVPARVAVE